MFIDKITYDKPLLFIKNIKLFANKTQSCCGIPDRIPDSGCAVKCLKLFSFEIFTTSHVAFEVDLKETFDLQPISVQLLLSCFESLKNIVEVL